MKQLISILRYDLWPALKCCILHRNWQYGIAYTSNGKPWPSGLYKECQVCGYTIASGTRSWVHWNRRPA